MDDLELKQLWHTYNQKVEAVLETNQIIIAKQHKQAVKHVISSLDVNKLFSIVVSVLWIIVLVNIAVASSARPAFAFSMLMIAVISLSSVMSYVRHLVLISRITYSDNILNIQESVAQLQLSQLYAVRIAFLQLPFYFTWYFNSGMFNNGEALWGILQVVLLALSISVSIWLFRNLTPANKNKKWFKVLVKHSGWDTGNKAIDLLNDVEAFKGGA